MSLRHVLERRDPDEVPSIAADVIGVEVGAFRDRRRNSVLRAVAARMLCRHAGLTQREAADVLGVGNGAGVGRQKKKLAETLATDSNLRRIVREIENRLIAGHASRVCRACRVAFGVKVFAPGIGEAAVASRVPRL